MKYTTNVDSSNNFDEDKFNRIRNNTFAFLPIQNGTVQPYELSSSPYQKTVNDFYKNIPVLPLPPSIPSWIPFNQFLSITAGVSDKVKVERK